MSEALITVNDLSKRFVSRQGVLTAVDQVSFTVQRSRHLGLVGASGSGKSTVVKLVQRLLSPTSGQIAFAGQDITKLPERHLRPVRRRMQSVSQNPYASLFPNKTIGQNIIEPMLTHKIGTRTERITKASELMERVGVSPDHFYAFPHEISGGQQQRIAIARALALDPELLILDEAVSSLDVSIQAQILHLLNSLRDQFDLTFLFVSHNLAVVRLLCPEVAVMFLGRIVEMGPSEEVFARPSHPYTKALLAAVPEFESNDDVSNDQTETLEPPSPYAIPSGCCYRTLCPLADARCASESPKLHETGPGHRVACHYANQWA